MAIAQAETSSEAEIFTPESVAEVFLHVLRQRGVGNFFVNAGTDFAPIVEGYARLADDVDSFPRIVIAGHENVSMGMAHGAYLMSGKPQAVMFHVNVGTANAVCGAMNAATEQVPLLICAGRSPIYEGGTLGARSTRVAWAQEMFDQASIMRESVKWEYELRGPLHAQDVVDRALTIAMTAPRGPVYLTLPREVLAEAPVAAKAERPRLSIPTRSRPDPEAVGRVADQLVAAELPVLSSLASGADSASVDLLATLCDRYAIGYVEEQARYLNCPSDHPLHFGYAVAPVLRDADALLFIESDVPWMSEKGEPRSDAFVAQAGIDPNFSRYPMRTHRSDEIITSGATELLEALGDALENRKGLIPADRHERLRTRSAAARTQAALARDAELARAGTITPLFLSATLAPLLDDGCVLFNEYWGARNVFDINRAGSYFYLPATGGLGWAIPSALGARVEAPERTMIALVGDGTYMFSNPTACHHAGEKHGLPMLTIIANNARWDAVDATARLVYPTGHMAKQQWMATSDLRPAPAYERLVEASGGYGVTVSERGELAAVLRRALDVVQKERRQAVVNVISQ